MKAFDVKGFVQSFNESYAFASVIFAFVFAWWYRRRPKK